MAAKLNNNAIFPPIFSAVNQEYITGVHEEYVVRGNNALLKCSVPSFVADLISVVSWHDTHKNSYTLNPSNFGKIY